MKSFARVSPAVAWAMVGLMICFDTRAGAVTVPVIGACEGCEAVFVDMPASIPATARIAPVNEKGTPLVIEGTVRNASGAAVAGIIVYAYHTDANGLYPAGAVRHGRLRGWARSDAQGRYRFDTIRPAPYPGAAIPQHIHMHVIEPGRGTYYIDDIIFSDDPLLTTKHRQQMRAGRGGYGESLPVRDAQGVWQVRRDIVLGEKITGYPR